MKKLLNFDPIFNPTLKTLDFSGLPNFQFDRLYGVINVSRSTPLYIPGVSGYGATFVGPVVTLTFDTTSHSTNDELNIYYETSAGGWEDNTSMELGGYLQASGETLNQILIELKLMNILLLEGLSLSRQQEELEQIRQSLIMDAMTRLTHKD